MTTTDQPVLERARAALQLAEADPGRAVPVATAVARQARAEGDGAAISVAACALGGAALHRGDPEAGVRHLRAAVRAGAAAGDAALVVAARLRLAAVLNLGGHP